MTFNIHNKTEVLDNGSEHGGKGNSIYSIFWDEQDIQAYAQDHGHNHYIPEECLPAGHFKEAAYRTGNGIYKLTNGYKNQGETADLKLLSKYTHDGRRK